MRDRRSEQRLFCSELVSVHWRDEQGEQSTVANLEDISPSGACLLLESELPVGTQLKLEYPGGKLTGRVKYCVHREYGYLVGIQFIGEHWSESRFQPSHLLNPRKLLGESATKSNSSTTPGRLGRTSHEKTPF